MIKTKIQGSRTLNWGFEPEISLKNTKLRLQTQTKLQLLDVVLGKRRQTTEDESQKQ